MFTVDLELYRGKEARDHLLQPPTYTERLSSDRGALAWASVAWQQGWDENPVLPVHSSTPQPTNIYWACTLDLGGTQGGSDPLLPQLMQ